MRTLVDTCVISELRRPKGSVRVRERLASLPDEDLFLSVLTVGELRKGIGKLRASAKKRSLEAWLDQLVTNAGGRVLPIDADTAAVWGDLTARCEKQGRPIPAIDGLLAAIALRHGLCLMTRNARDFEPTGVTVVNPW